MRKPSTKEWITLAIFALVIPASIFFMSYGGRPVTSAPVIKEDLNESLNVQQWNFPDGPRVYTVERDAHPIVDIKLIFDAGSARDKIPGTASMVARLLDKGSKHYSADEIAEKFESVGARLSIHADRDRLTISCRSLSDRAALSRVIPLLQEMAAAPRFDAEMVEVSKSQLQVWLEREKKEPSEQADKSFMAQLYQDHPYAHEVKGTLQSVPLITENDLKNFHQQYFVPENLTVVVVGDVDAGTVDDWVKSLKQALPKGAKSSPIEKVASTSIGQIQHIDFDATQTHLRYGLPVELGNDPDHYALKMAEQVIGGGFNSRLYNEVRRDNGLAYSVRANSAGWQGEGPFYIKIETRSEKAEEVIERVKSIVKDMLENGPTSEELRVAKKSVKGQLSLMFSSNEWIAAHLGTMAFYNKPLDFYEEYAARLEAVTAEEVKRVLRERAPLEKWTLVTVGPA
jgi:zinc protease